MRMIVWVVGEARYIGSQEWEMIGVFSTQEKANKACILPRYFVGPAEMDKAFPGETVPWPGAYFPIHNPSEIILND